jgi:hypothetical protein
VVLHGPALVLLLLRLLVLRLIQRRLLAPRPVPILRWQLLCPLHHRGTSVGARHDCADSQQASVLSRHRHAALRAARTAATAANAAAAARERPGDLPPRS